MMVFDEVKGLGWFVSDRFQPEGKACVYLFIPNPEHKRVESEDIEVKRARAAITAIRDSWKESSDYADLIRLSHTEIPYGEKKIEKDLNLSSVIILSITNWMTSIAPKLRATTKRWLP